MRVRGLIFRELYINRKNYIYIFAIWFIITLFGVLVKLSLQYGNMKNIVTENDTEAIIYNIFTFLPAILIISSWLNFTNVILSDYTSRWHLFWYSCPGHAPLTCSGHNFGTDYPGFPFVGIATMCIFCVLMGCVLTYLTRKTKSIYPAAILHSINNNIAPIFIIMLVSQKTLTQNVIKGFFTTIVPISVISLFLFILMQMNNKKIQSSL